MGGRNCFITIGAFGHGLTYMEVSDNGLVSYLRKGCNQNAYFFIKKCCHDKVNPGYTLPFCITKPVDKR